MPHVEYGCAFCADDQNRWFGHLDQLSSNDLGLILLRCPHCGSFYSNTAGGWDETKRLTSSEAELAFPDWSPSGDIRRP
jgi:hypothetical protein